MKLAEAERRARERRTGVFYYNRQIVYMDLWKAGERIRTAGFLKLEETDRGLRWQMSIRGLERTDTGFYDLRDETGALVDKLLLQKGEGHYERILKREAVTRGGRLFREICGLQAKLAGGRYLKGTWKLSERTEASEERKAAEPERGHPPVPKGRHETVLQAKPAHAPALPPSLETPSCPQEEAPPPDRCERSGSPQNGCLQAAGARKQPGREAEPGKPGRAAEPGKPGRGTEPEKPGRGAEPGRPGRETEPGRPVQAAGARQRAGNLQPVYYEDKWEQLKHMYPQIHPFGDERMFLSITPGDFVILGKEYQRLVNNSFLLHGYYNYRHLILGRYPEEEGGEGFYLGVPGVCYEREKMAAEMFGFEAFEGKREPAAEGDFGYYMKRVRI